MKKNWKDETVAIHAAEDIDGGVGAVSTPIFQTSTYRVSEPGDESGHVYSRTSNPTRIALEETLAALENGSNGYAFASGMAAVNTVMNLLKKDDHVIAGDDLYGGCYRLFEKVFTRYGISFDYVDARQPEKIFSVLNEKTKMIWLETPTNPLMYLYDIKALAEIARKHELFLAVDNTFATPYIQRPLDLGADIVVHSLTKYISGHADTVGGAIVVKDSALSKKIGFYQNSVGAISGPFDSFLALRGLKTLAIRMERHSYNAQKIVEYLSDNPLVNEIYFPGIDGADLPNNMRLPGGMISFTIDADLDAVKNFAAATSLFILAESLGGVESLINHPALMTHASIPKEIRDARGITDNLIRLSVGIENVDDLIEDLDNAFRTINNVTQNKIKMR